MGGRVRTCPVSGPLAPRAAGFEAWLVGRGFSSFDGGSQDVFAGRPESTA
jgi:hypothetical protein